METREVSVWLVPAQSIYSELQQIIDRLAREQGAVSFEPHITLYGATVPVQEIDSIKARLTVAVGQFTEISLKSTGLNYSANFFKTLFIEIEPSPALTNLQKAVAAAVGQSDYSFAPHLSLLYKTMPNDEKAALIPNIQVPPTFTADSLKLSIPGNAEAGWQDITNWQIIASYQLNGVN